MNKRILNLAVPNILSNLSVPLLSSVDTIVVGHLDGVHFLGAIAVGSMIFNFVYWGFGFLRMGTTGMTAQAFGKKNSKEVSLIFYRAMGFAAIAGLLLIILRVVIGNLAFNIVSGSPEVELYARSYFDIRIFAAPATLALYVFHGWFLGMQDAKVPLLLTVFVNILNIGLNLLFVYNFDMKSDGVALGTVCAQYSGLLLAGVFYFVKYRGYLIKVSLNEFRHKEVLRKFFGTNIDIFIRTLLLIFVFSFFTAKSAEFDNTILAANTILIQLWTIMSYGIDGFAFAAESLIGKYLGARDKMKFNLAIKYLFMWGVGLGLVISTLYYLFDKQIISAFTSNNRVAEIALVLMPWTIAAPVINGFSYIWDGIYIGATATKAMRNSMIICALFLYLPVYYLTQPIFGNNALWLALTIFMFARGASLTLYSSRSIYSLLE